MKSISNAQYLSESISIEDFIADKISREIANEIHREVEWSLKIIDCTEKGWTLVNLDRFTDNNHAIDITEWIKNNVKGQYHRNGRHFIFENNKDASWFLLRRS